VPSSRPNHPRSTHPQGERRAPVEALERRELLANDPLQLTWTRTGAFLNVYGSVNADAITVNRASVSKTGVSTVVVTNGTWSTTYKGRVDGIRVWAGRGNDQVTVTSARPVPVVITGDRGNDTITGDILDDRLDGGGGSDQVNGGAGNDYLTGAAGSDTLNGGAGSDRLDGNGGADQLNGGDGTDTVDYRSRSAPLNLSLDNIANDGEGGEFDRIGGDCEVLLAGSGDDKLIGNSGANVFYGGPGRDTIRGDAGNDTIDGGAGDDALYAGDGADVVYGRDGDDQILALGGGTDVAYGGAGVDSAWLDAAETLADQAAEETAAGSVHRVGSFVNQSAVSGSLTQSKQIEVAEPTTSANAPLGDFASHPLFSASGPTAADVVQGQLGDCWWLSTLAAVAQAKPDVIRRSISDLGDGSFAVRLYQDGQPTYVRVE
jgi:Ca2+-binding RTX toxin-like protein